MNLKKLFGLSVLSALVLSGCNVGPQQDSSSSSTTGGDTSGDTSGDYSGETSGDTSGDASGDTSGSVPPTESWKADVAEAMQETLGLLLPVYPLSDNYDIDDDRGDYGFCVFDNAYTMSAENYKAKFDAGKPAGWTNAEWDSDIEWYFASNGKDEEDEDFSWFAFFEDSYEGEDYFAIQFDSNAYVPEKPEVTYLEDWTAEQKAAMTANIGEVLPFIEDVFRDDSQFEYSSGSLYLYTEIDSEDDDLIESVAADYLDLLEKQGGFTIVEDGADVYAAKEATIKVTLGEESYDSNLYVSAYLDYTIDWTSFSIIYLFVIQATIEMKMQEATAFPADQFALFLDDVEFPLTAAQLGGLFDLTAEGAKLNWMYQTDTAFGVMGPGKDVQDVLDLAEVLEAKGYIIEVDASSPEEEDDDEGDDEELRAILRQNRDPEEEPGTPEGGEGEEEALLEYEIYFSEFKGDYEGYFTYSEDTKELVFVLKYSSLAEGYFYSETFPSEELEEYGVTHLPGFDVGDSAFKYIWTDDTSYLNQDNDYVDAFGVRTYIGEGAMAGKFAENLETLFGEEPYYDDYYDEYYLTLEEYGEEIYFYDYNGYFCAYYSVFEPVVPTYGFDFTSDLSSYKVSLTTDKLEMKKDNVSLTLEKNGSTQDVGNSLNEKYLWGTNNGLRVYGKQKLTLKAVEGVLDTITIEGVQAIDKLAVTGGTVVSQTASELVINATASEVVLVASEQVRITSIVCTFVQPE